MGRTLYRILSRLVLRPWFRLTRGLTLGVRVLVQNRQGEILLVRHTYAPGWFLPGGGVERGEVAEEAATCEVLEETGANVVQPLKLVGVYSNEATFEGDHVLLYLGQTIDNIKQKGNLEIAEARFFSAAALPEGTTAGTKRRVREMLDAAPPADRW